MNKKKEKGVGKIKKKEEKRKKKGRKKEKEKICRKRGRFFIQLGVTRLSKVTPKIVL